MLSKLSCKIDNVKNIRKNKNEDGDKERKKNTNMKSKVKNESMYSVEYNIYSCFIDDYFNYI